MLSEADNYIYRINKLLQEEDLSAAFDLLSEMLQKFPDHGIAHALTGKLYKEYGQDNIKAEQHLKKAIQLSPTHLESYIRLSDLFLWQERTNELIALLNKALEVPGPVKDRVYEKFGLMNELQLKFDDAIVHYKKAISNSLSLEDIKKYEQSIERCVYKKKYLH
ncbi:MAG TPA: hypothetical protein PKH65_03255 [Bacteroidia bacterium]|nr:hypothetical protein [Bacteroidia bacterium]HNT79675.1 hypothetical protein [Bacteroidia bacterium]